MYILSEREMEDILVLHPELIEKGLILIERQGQIENRRTDLLFKDSHNHLLLVELKKDIVTEENIDQIEDYINKINKTKQAKCRGMIIGQLIPPQIQVLCEERNIEWKEIKNKDLYLYLQEHNSKLFNQTFIAEKLSEKMNQVKI